MHLPASVRKWNDLLKSVIAPIVLYVVVPIACMSCHPIIFLMYTFALSFRLNAGVRNGTAEERAFNSNMAYRRIPMPMGAAVNKGMFFEALRQRLDAKYIVLVDRSSSMCGARWADAEAAVETVVAATAKFQPNGVSVMFYNKSVTEFDGVKSAAEVQVLFANHFGKGGSNLALGLHHAFERHFEGSDPTAILVLTGGEPDSMLEVERIVRRGAKSISSDSELSVTFIQIGTETDESLERLTCETFGLRLCRWAVQQLPLHRFVDVLHCSKSTGFTATVLKMSCGCE